MPSHELCASSIDQYGNLREITKSSLMAKLAVYITDQLVPDLDIASGNALLYHITWPQDCLCYCSICFCLRSGTTNYHPPLTFSSHKIIVRQNRYLNVSNKGAKYSPAYEFKLSTPLPPREQIMRSTANKKVFS